MSISVDLINRRNSLSRVVTRIVKERIHTSESCDKFTLHSWCTSGAALASSLCTPLAASLVARLRSLEYI